MDDCKHSYNSNSSALLVQSKTNDTNARIPNKIIHSNEPFSNNSYVKYSTNPIVEENQQDLSMNKENNNNLSFTSLDDDLQDEMKNLNLIDQIICKYGYGFQVIRMIIVSFLLSYFTGYMIFHVSSNLLILEKNLSNEETQKTIGSILTYSSYFFRGLGSFVLIFLKFKRTTIVYVCIGVIVFLNILISAYFVLWTYFIYNIVGCFLAGLIDPINSDILCESLPINFRGFFMCMFTFGSALSQLVHFAMVNRIYREAENNFHEVLFCGTLIMFFISLIVVFNLKDSPRNLLLRDEVDQAHIQLENFFSPSRKLTNHEKVTLYQQTHFGLNFRLEKNLKSLFDPVFIKITVLFIGIVLSFKAIDDGISSILTIYIQKITKTNDDVLISNEGIKINCLGLLGPILSGMLVEFKTFGRKIGLFITGCLIFLSYVLFTFNLSNFSLWLGFINIFCNASTSIIITIVTETYPTVFRDVSEGFFNSMISIGSLLGSIIFLNLINLNFNAPFYFQIANSLIGLVLVMFIRYDTCRKQLDHYQNENSIQTHIDSIGKDEELSYFVIKN